MILSAFLHNFAICATEDWRSGSHGACNCGHVLDAQPLEQWGAAAVTLGNFFKLFCFGVTWRMSNRSSVPGVGGRQRRTLFWVFGGFVRPAMLPILWRFLFCGSRFTVACAPIVGIFCLLSDLPSMGRILGFLRVWVFWLAAAPPFLAYWALTVLLLAAFLVPNGALFFVAFEGSLVPISLLVLWGGLRPERLAAVAYMSVYTLVGGGVHVLGLLASLKMAGSLKWLLREPFIFSTGGCS